MKKFFVIIILFSSVSNIYSQKPCPGIPTVTYEGKTYNTVKIGDQCWLKENLDVGKIIPGDRKQEDNKIIEKYCYDNKLENCEKYGGLYQWSEAMAYTDKDGAKGICPDGWHIPTKNKDLYFLQRNAFRQATTLITKDIDNSYNRTGFTAMMAGIADKKGVFSELGLDTYFWSSSRDYTTDEVNPNTYVYCLIVSASYKELDSRLKNVSEAISVRCIKD